MTGRLPTFVHTLFRLQMKHSIESEGDITLVSVACVRSVIVMHSTQESNYDGREKCLTSETPWQTHVYLGFKVYSITVQFWIILLHIRLRNCTCDIISIGFGIYHVVLNVKCVFILIKSVTSKNFLSRFQSFFGSQNMVQTVHDSYKKNVFLKTYCLFSVFQFSLRDISICTSVVF
jgi:hypothetical protein